VGSNQKIGLGFAAAAALGLAAAAVWWGSGAGRGGPMHRAEAFYRAGDWKNASALAREQLGKTPGDDDALRLYARSLARQGRDESAAKIYNGRLGAAKMRGEDFLLLGRILERSGNLEMAFGIWSKAAKDFPPSAELLEDLTRLAFRMQRLDVAQAHAEQLSRLPGSETKGEFWRGVIQATLGDLPGATKFLTDALDRDPTAKAGAFPEFQYRRQLAQVLLQLGKPEPAIKQLQRIKADARAESKEFDPHSAWLLSRAYLQESKFDAGRQALEAAGSFRRDHPHFPEPSPYIGESRCIKCHSEIGESHRQTRHARTFHHGEKLLKLPRPDRPLPDPDDQDVTQTLFIDDGKLQTETHVDDKVYRTVVDYAFGTENRYLSYVSKDESGICRVFRLSYYVEDGHSGWGRSSGDVGHDDRIQRVRGPAVHVQDGIVRCLACHVTNVRNFAESTDPKDRGPEAADRGIGCEQCHGPGANHKRAVDVGFPDLAISAPPSMSAEASTRLCAECHIVGSKADIELAPGSERFARSPGLTMTFSRCYTESQGGMSCLTCHDPHRDAEKSPAFYEAKCLKCHDGGKRDHTVKPPADGPVAGRGSICKVNPASDCLGCHMPKVRMPVLHTSLTDHFIRVREAEGE
jgi:tetratricopeptide (TPR) repeat protein